MFRHLSCVPLAWMMVFSLAIGSSHFVRLVTVSKYFSIINPPRNSSFPAGLYIYIYIYILFYDVLCNIAKQVIQSDTVKLMVAICSHLKCKLFIVSWYDSDEFEGCSTVLSLQCWCTYVSLSGHLAGSIYTTKPRDRTHVWSVVPYCFCHVISLSRAVAGQHSVLCSPVQQSSLHPTIRMVCQSTP